MMRITPMMPWRLPSRLLTGTGLGTFFLGLVDLDKLLIVVI